MSVRVTQNMLNNNMLRNLNNSMRNMDKLQDQLSSGKKISKPSDDPVVAARGMFYRSSLIENEQYKRNVSQVQSWMDMTDQTLDEVGNVMKRVQELLVNAADGALSQEDLQAIAAEVEELKNHMGTLANQQINGKYIFAGTDTNLAPYDPAAQGGRGDFVGTNSEAINLEVSQGVFVRSNTNGQSIFNFPDNANNIFKVLNNIVDELNSGNNASQYQAAISAQFDNLLAERATLGASVNRVDLIAERLEVQEVTITGLLSKNEDADLAKVITDLTTQESVHSAALGAGARIIQPTLVDFLR